MHREQAKRDQQGFGRQVVIDSLQGLSPTCFAASGEVADFDCRLGIDGDSECVRFIHRPSAGGLDVLKDRVGLGNLFSGRAFWTRRSR